MPRATKQHGSEAARRKKMQVEVWCDMCECYFMVEASDDQIEASEVNCNCPDCGLNEDRQILSA